MDLAQFRGRSTVRRHVPLHDAYLLKAQTVTLAKPVTAKAVTARSDEASFKPQVFQSS